MSNVAVIDIVKIGMRIWNNTDDFLNWLSKPNPFLDGEIPSVLMDTAEGRELVFKILTAIEHGVYS